MKQAQTGKTPDSPVLTISSKNYSSWSLRGWLMCRIAGLEIEEQAVSLDDPDNRAELLLLAPSTLVPRLDHDGCRIWDVIAIGEYLAETFPDSGVLPENRRARAHCRSISGEVHSGFYNLRSALPMNLGAKYPNFKVFAGALADIERIETIWAECMEKWGGPFLFGTPTMADAMFAPVCTRFDTYGVEISDISKSYCQTILNWAPMVEWINEALAEPDDFEELDMEF
jgi:glutathione S-transferase